MTTTATERRLSTRFRPSRPGAAGLTPAARRCRRKFLNVFPNGFRDDTYVDWERGYKWQAHERWCELLRRALFRSCLDAGEYETIAKYAVSIESRTNLLFSFEKMALRDAVRGRTAARQFAEGLWSLLYEESESDEERFERWVATLDELPRRQTRVLTWPMATIWGFIAQPEEHIFIKPTVTRRAAVAYGFDFDYRSRPNWATYCSMLEFAGRLREDQGNLGARDMIDLQSFIWVQGSDEYEE